MATVYRLSNFGDIQTYIQNELKVQSADTESVNRIKRSINSYYLNELMPKKDWWWARRRADIVTQPAFTSGTASVVGNSTAVTLTEAPASSREGWYFVANSYNEIYRVRSHVGGSTTLELETPYMGVTDTAIRFTLFTDEVPLPADCASTFEVNHDFFTQPMMGLGFQDFRATAKTDPRFEGYPEAYTQDDYIVPDQYASIDGLPATATKKSEGFLKYIKFNATLGATGSTLLKAGDRFYASGSDDAEYYDGEFIVQAVTTTSTTNDTIIYASNKSKKSIFAADTGITIKLLDTADDNKRLKKLRIYPAIFRSKVLLHVDYTQIVPPLENDTDIPMMPQEDRIILAYGPLSQLWSSIGRNPEEAKRNFDLAQNKLADMMARYSDSVDFPKFVVSQSYLRLKRSRRTLNG